jgi:LPS-assembly protein
VPCHASSSSPAPGVLRPLAAALLCALGSGTVHAQAQSAAPNPASPATPAVTLKLERALGAGRVRSGEGGASIARAERMRNEDDERIVLEGRAELRNLEAVLRADRIVYTVATDELQATGNVRTFRDGFVVTGPSLTTRLDAQTGTMPDAQFRYAARAAGGAAGLLEFLGDGRVRMRDATFSSCTPPDTAWWVKANELAIDRDAELAVARGATLYFQGVPVLASPYLQFPVGEKRRSGLLTPSFGINSRLGVETTIPYYFNIAPNRDATVSARVMSRRGVMLENEFRYLEPTFRGTLQYDTLPVDRSTGSSREALSLRHEYASPRGFVGGWNVNRVSDDRYFVDFGNNIVTASQSVLPQEGFVGYNQPFWNTALRVTRNQFLVDPLNPAQVKPYERVPQLTFNALRADLGGFDLSVAADITRFEHPTLEPGTRSIVNPAIAYPWLAPGGFIIPRVQWHGTRYELDPARRPSASSLSRSVPIASLDAGLVFERTVQGGFDSPTLQTLEPRLYYSYIPLRDQNALPVFDTALADFNFAQLFTENPFVGGDRIGQANQITAALVSRLLDVGTGAERLRVALGQRYFFSPQQVTLPGGVPRDDKESDVLFALSGSLARHWIADVALQHSTLQKQVVRATAGIRYQPRPASVLSLTYRYKINEIEQLDVATQWPLSTRWYGLARANYSMRDGRWAEVLGGLEYKAECWVFRVAAQRFATAVQTSTTTVFFQLELNGLGGIGTSPVETLRRNIPGYQLITPLPRQSGPYESYE